MSAGSNGQSGVDMGSFFDESTLATAAANELSTPLVLLRQLSLALAADDISDSERLRLSEQLTLTTERALRLTANLQLPSAQGILLELEPINSVSLCQEVVHELSPLFMAHGQRITLQPRSRVPLLVANRQLLRRILLAFGDNALHYGSAEQPVQLAISGHHDRIRIGVRDYGPAVPSDIWQRLDDRIARRATVALANRPHASGMSLAVARQLAGLMDSVVGTVRHHDGATFYIDLRVSGQMSLL